MAQATLDSAVVPAAAAGGCRDLEAEIKHAARRGLEAAVVTTQRALVTAGEPPDIDRDLLQYDLFTLFGDDRIDWMCNEFIGKARQLGLTVEDLGGDLRPDVLDAVTALTVRAIWFGLTEAHVTITQNVHVPRRLILGLGDS